MSREAANTLFQAHATARLRGDTAEATRLASLIGPELHMKHAVFLTALLAGIVVEEYGSQPDPQTSPNSLNACTTSTSVPARTSTPYTPRQ